MAWYLLAAGTVQKLTMNTSLKQSHIFTQPARNTKLFPSISSTQQEGWCGRSPPHLGRIWWRHRMQCHSHPPCGCRGSGSAAWGRAGRWSGCLPGWSVLPGHSHCNHQSCSCQSWQLSPSVPCSPPGLSAWASAWSWPWATWRPVTEMRHCHLLLHKASSSSPGHLLLPPWIMFPFTGNTHRCNQSQAPAHGMRTNQPQAVWEFLPVLTSVLPFRL